MLPPAIARLTRRLFSAPPPIESIAARTWCIEPEHATVTPPAVFEPADLDRVTGLGDSTTMQRERERIDGGECIHGQITAWELRDAVLSRSHIYKGLLKHRVDARSEGWFNIASARPVPEGVLSCTFYGGVYFGHSIKDDMPLTLLAESLGNPVRSSAPLHGHQEAYLRMARLHSTPYDSARFGRLWIIDDNHQSKSRIQRTREIRSRIRAYLPRPEHPGVFINRGGSGSSRRMTNEAEVIAQFVSRGFAIVDPETMDADEILLRVSGAKIVAGVEGSHLSHGVLSCADDCTFLVLQPPTRFNNVFKDFTDAMAMRYAFIVGQQVAGSDFRIDAGELSRMLDRLQH